MPLPDIHEIVRFYVGRKRHEPIYTLILQYSGHIHIGNHSLSWLL